MPRLAFRFAVVYLALFCLATQISGSMVPNLLVSYRGLGRLWPMRDITGWTASSVFGIDVPLDAASGGETLFFWVQSAWILIAAVLITATWIAVDRRPRHDALNRWFRLFVRLALAASLLEYGMTKVIPTQFPAPPLTTLVTPVGNLSLSALLWTSVGAAQPYQIFTGCIEVLAAILLLIPRTATLGAAVGLVALIQIFALNMTYDIGVKFVTLHLIALTLIVMAPDLPRLVDFFWRHRPAAASIPAPPVQGARARRLIAGAQIAFGLYLLGMYAFINWSFWNVAGDGRPRSVLYGIWNVEALSVDGQLRPPDLNDYDRRWRRVIFDDPDVVVVQRTDDSLARFGAALDPQQGVLSLRKGTSRKWQAAFTIARESPDTLMLLGTMDGQRLEARLRRVDFEAFPLLHSTFRWVRPHDP